MQHSTIAVAALIVFVAWRVLARVRRLVGRQRLRLARLRATVLVFPFLVGLLCVGALGETEALLALVVGGASGVALALIGFRRTRFEVAPDGRLFYTPCGPIGIGLAAVLIARLLYSAIGWMEAHGAGSAAAGSFALTPATLFMFATLASYYSAYSLGLLLWRHRLQRR